MGGQIFDDAPRLQGYHIDCDIPVIIGLDTDDGPEHCLWDQSDRNAEGDPIFAAELVMDGGIRQPVLCRANGVIKKGGSAEVGVGRRRVQAARLIKHKPKLVRDVLAQLDVKLRVEPILVPVMVEKHTDDEWRRIVAAENAQRKDLSFRDKVAQALRMLERVKNKGAVAAVYGVSVACVAEWELTKDLDEQVLALVGPGRGQLSQTAAIQLVSLPREKQVERARALTADGARPTARHTRAAAKGDDAEPHLTDTELGYIARSEECDPAIRDFARCVLGEYPRSKIRGVIKALRTKGGKIAEA